MVLCVEAKRFNKLYELITNDPVYQELEEETYDVIAEHIKTVELFKTKEYSREGGKVNMCNAIAQLIQRGRMEGLSEGIEPGVKALIEMSIEYHNTREATQEQLVEKMCIPPEAAQKYIGQYWH